MVLVLTDPELDRGDDEGIIFPGKISCISSVPSIIGNGKLFTRRARFGKTVKAAGRTLIGKQGENLFLKITVYVRM